MKSRVLIATRTYRIVRTRFGLTEVDKRDGRDSVGVSRWLPVGVSAIDVGTLIREIGNALAAREKRARAARRLRGGVS